MEVNLRLLLHFIAVRLYHWCDRSLRVADLELTLELRRVHVWEDVLPDSMVVQRVRCVAEALLGLCRGAHDYVFLGLLISSDSQEFGKMITSNNNDCAWQISI
jgi:hypothetical protein